MLKVTVPTCVSSPVRYHGLALHWPEPWICVIDCGRHIICSIEQYLHLRCQLCDQLSSPAWHFPAIHHTWHRRWSPLGHLKGNTMSKYIPTCPDMENPGTMVYTSVECAYPMWARAEDRRWRIMAMVSRHASQLRYDVTMSSLWRTNDVIFPA